MKKNDLFALVAFALSVVLFLVVVAVVFAAEPDEAAAPFQRRPVTPETVTYEWSKTLSAVNMNPSLVEAVDGEHVWVTSYNDSSSIFFYDGSEWTRQLSTNCTLNSLSAYGENNVWAAGYDDESLEGIMFFFDGTAWSEQYRAHGEIGDICATGLSDAWAMKDGDALRFDGAVWNVVPGPPGGISRFSAASNGSVFAYGENGCWRYDGASWTDQLTIDTYVLDICAVDSGRAWLLAEGGTAGESGVEAESGNPSIQSRIYYFNGDAWRLQYETETVVNSLGATTSREAWAWCVVSCHGPFSLLHYDGKTWNDYQKPGIANINCISPQGKGITWLTGGFG